MRAAALKVLAGACLLATGGWGVNRAVRARHDAGGTVSSARLPLPAPGQPLTVTPRPIPGRVAVLPATSPPRRPTPPPDAVTADPWLDSPEPAPPIHAAPLRAQVPRRRLGAASPGRLPSGLRLPATATAPAPPPSRPLTAAPPRPRVVPRPAAPAGSPGLLGFEAEPSAQRNPVLTMENAENATMVVTFTGPRVYKRALPPGAVVQIEIEPGSYRAQVRSTALGSVPNRGAGEFRPFNRYYARWRSVPLGSTTPLRLGELAAGKVPEKPEEPDTAGDPPEEAPVKPMPETP